MRHRHALLTAALIGAVVLAAAVAIGVNLGILNAAEAGALGQLSAAAPDDWAAAAGTEPDQTQGSANEPQQYIVDTGGTVDVLAGETDLRVVGVDPRRGWTYRLVQTTDDKLTVVFERRDTILRFTARLTADGAIRARVTQPVTVRGSAQATTGTVQPASAGASRPVTSQPTSSVAGPDTDDEHEDDEDHADDEEREGEDDDD